MIRGRVDARREARVTLEIRDAGGQFQSIAGIIDTGFNGHLTLPLEVIRRLHLEQRVPTNVTLATGVRSRLNTWMGQVLWHDGPRTIRILESEGIPLLGMELLQDSQLTVQVRVGGDVLIEALGGVEA